jgi:hypothetical protein
VTYFVRSYLDSLNRYAVHRLEPSDVRFSLVTYNAQDFGFRYGWVDSLASRSVDNRFQSRKPVELDQEVRLRSKACGLPGGCNQATDPQPEFGSLRALDLPAAALVKLWTSEPRDVLGPADFTFEIELR